MLIVDAHLDLSWNALGWNRDLEQPVEAIRRSEAGMEGKSRGQNTVAFPEMRRGKIGIAFATVLSRFKPQGTSSIDFRTQEAASAMAFGQLAYYQLLERRGVCRMVHDLDTLNQLYAVWLAGGKDAPLAFVLSMEGADPIMTPDHAETWYRAGLRLVGLAHYGPSVYAHGTGCEGGLTQQGRDLLREMERLGLILDMTHLADESFWEAAEHFHGPLLASHNNCRALTPGQRQFSDEQLRLIIERGGVIGAAFDAWMLTPDWNSDPAKRPSVPLANVVDNIDHICQLAGNAKHVAIGSDLDGGFGKEQSPDELDTIADLQKLLPLLAQRGYSEQDIEGIFHRNWIELLRRAWS